MIMLVSCVNTPDAKPKVSGNIPLSSASTMEIESIGSDCPYDETAFIIDDFNDEIFEKEVIRSDINTELFDGAACGNYTKISYTHSPGDEIFHSARIIYSRYSLPNISDYSELHLVMMLEKNTDQMKILINDQDQDFWWYSVPSYLDAGQWYHVKIPLDKLQIDPGYPRSGDGIRDYDDRLAILFEPKSGSNTLLLDTIYLTK